MVCFIALPVGILESVPGESSNGGILSGPLGSPNLLGMMLCVVIVYLLLADSIVIRYEEISYNKSKICLSCAIESM